MVISGKGNSQLSATSGPNQEPRSPNIELIRCQSVRQWSGFLSLRTVVRATMWGERGGAWETLGEGDTQSEGNALEREEGNSMRSLRTTVKANDKRLVSERQAAVERPWLQADCFVRVDQ